MQCSYMYDFWVHTVEATEIGNLTTTKWRQIRLTNLKCYFQISLILACAHKKIKKGKHSILYFTLQSI